MSSISGFAQHFLTLSDTLSDIKFGMWRVILFNWIRKSRMYLSRGNTSDVYFQQQWINLVPFAWIEIGWIRVEIHLSALYIPLSILSFNTTNWENDRLEKTNVLIESIAMYCTLLMQIYYMGISPERDAI